MKGLTIRRDACALDFLALGALVHRLDPGLIPFRKARTLDVHVSGGEYNVAANLADCFGLKTGVAPGDFEMLQSLVLLLLVTIGGVNTVTGAFIGGFVFTMIPVLQEHVGALRDIQGLQFLGVGLGAMTLGRKPNGIAGDIAAAGESLRARFRRKTPEAPARLDTTEVDLVSA